MYFVCVMSALSNIPLCMLLFPPVVVSGGGGVAPPPGHWCSGAVLNSQQMLGFGLGSIAVACTRRGLCRRARARARHLLLVRCQVYCLKQVVAARAASKKTLWIECEGVEIKENTGRNRPVLTTF